MTGAPAPPHQLLIADGDISSTAITLALAVSAMCHDRWPDRWREAMAHMAQGIGQHVVQSGEGDTGLHEVPRPDDGGLGRPE